MTAGGPSVEPAGDLSDRLTVAVSSVAGLDQASVPAIVEAVMGALGAAGVPAAMWALLKEREMRPGEDHSGPPSILGIYAARDDLVARVGKIAKANGQYPMRQLGDGFWRIGPEEDEGFFGHRPVLLYAREVAVHLS